MRSGGLRRLVFPWLAASSRMRVARVVSWTKLSVAPVLSPAITEPAARAKRRASAWSSKYNTTCPDIILLPESEFPGASAKQAHGKIPKTQVARQQTSVGDSCNDCRRMPVSVIVLLLVLFPACAMIRRLRMNSGGTIDRCIDFEFLNSMGVSSVACKPI